MTDRKPAAEPIPAATVLLLREGANGMEVFMVARKREIDSFSGALVFPGGKVDPSDQDAAALPYCRGAETFSERARSFRIATVRETFEECGVLLVGHKGKNGFVTAETWRRLDAEYRQDIKSGALTMADLCARENLEMATDVLVPFAHWITPKIVPRTFDTWFYLTPLPPGQIAEHDTDESADSVWTTPDDILAAADRKERTIVFPTRMNLIALNQNQNINEALDRATESDITAVRPVVAPHAEGRTLTIPAAAGYPGTVALVGKDGLFERFIE